MNLPGWATPVLSTLGMSLGLAVLQWGREFCEEVKEDGSLRWGFFLFFSALGLPLFLFSLVRFVRWAWLL